MNDNPQTASNPSLGSSATGFLGTVSGKVVAILAAISLIMGIALEVQSFVRGNYDVEASRNNAAITRAKAIVDTFGVTGNSKSPFNDPAESLLDKEIRLLQEEGRCLAHHGGTKEECEAPYKAFKAAHNSD